MLQATISEMRSYDRPPEVVAEVIRATFLLLGELPENLKVSIIEFLKLKI